jgi:hypothetical protein
MYLLLNWLIPVVARFDICSPVKLNRVMKTVFPFLFLGIGFACLGAAGGLAGGYGAGG